MRILVVGINFAPELTGIGKFTGEMATWLAARGHAVRAVSAPPYYPQWRIAAGYGGLLWRRETVDGVRVMRCPTWVPRRQTGVRRLLHLASFAATSLPVALAWSVAWRPQATIAVVPALMSAPAAWLAARLGGSLAWLHLQDLEVDAAFELGLLPSSLARPALAAERALLRRFDAVSTISEAMLARLSAKGVAPERRILFPNWTDLAAVAPRPDDGRLRAALGIARDATVALYSGNMGGKQGLETVIEAARRLAARGDIHFVLCGAGGARPALEAQATGLANVRFLDLQPLDRLGELLAFADIHLLPQRAEATDLVMPSKLGGMLASGRPVVAAAAPGTQLARALVGCGAVVPPGDAAGFAAAVAALADDPEARRVAGATARAAAERDWDRDAVLGRFEAALLARAGDRP
ncbi:MAG: WcaI family glycosyltransferase [Alphaproteobacteria bacterium]